MIIQPTKLFFLFILGGSLALAGCASHEEEKHEDEAHAWAYEGESGPTHWGALNAEWAVCSEGTEQSPINLTSAVVFEIDDPVFSYQDAPLSLINNGHTVQANFAAGSSITVEGIDYQLLQFHFHSQSEHSVDGVLLPMELHLVHQSSDGTLAVVGLLIEEGAFNPSFDSILTSLPATEGATNDPAGVTINALSLLPEQRTTYRYAGSLTTPPCSQGVAWMVMTSKIQLSAEQIAQYTTLFHGTNRPIQPLNSRVLVQDAS